MATTIKNYPEHHQELQGFMKQFARANPTVMKAFGQLHKAGSEEAVLSTKTKELIALGIAVAVRCDGCIAFHIADALKAGASEKEITEALGVAVLMGGGPAAIYSAQAFEALHQFQANPKMWAVGDD